jgi:hypothetical protein
MKAGVQTPYSRAGRLLPTRRTRSVLGPWGPTEARTITSLLNNIYIYTTLVEHRGLQVFRKSISWWVGQQCCQPHTATIKQISALLDNKEDSHGTENTLGSVDTFEAEHFLQCYQPMQIVVAFASVVCPLSGTVCTSCRKLTYEGTLKAVGRISMKFGIYFMESEICKF